LILTFTSGDLITELEVTLGAMYWGGIDGKL
jgi:hypothetical protein